MIAFVVEGYDPTPAKRGAVVVRMARAFPRARGLQLTLALASAADGMGTMLAAGWVQAPHLYRLAALVAVDVLQVELIQGRPALAADLLGFWGKSDSVFRDTAAPRPAAARADPQDTAP